MKLNTLLLIFVVMFAGLAFKCRKSPENAAPVGSPNYPTPTPARVAPELRSKIWQTPPPTVQGDSIECTAHALSFVLRSV